MAATRLITMHEAKGKSLLKSLSDRIDYSQNPSKTRDGDLISSYCCNPCTAASEFLLSKQEYLRITGRRNRGDIIAYQIRQSFRPGEISPEEANQVGYETAMRFTKGEHAFTVSTHIDRHHIHNHIIFNSTSLDCTRKFRDFFLCGLALQKVSDIVCLEHHLSIIKPLPYRKREKKKTYERPRTKREEVRVAIDAILRKNPRDLDAVFEKLQQEGFTCKTGKHFAVKRPGWKRFVRLDSLGEGYTEEDLSAYLYERHGGSGTERPKRKPDHSFDLLIDVQAKMQEGKGPGYERWARVFNVKQMAAALNFLQENDIHDYRELVRLSEEADGTSRKSLDRIHELDARIREATDRKKHIFNYWKTKDVYKQYQKSGYSAQFLEDHRQEISLHKAAKQAFDASGLEHLPKIKELNADYAELVAEKKKAYAEYRSVRDHSREYDIARKNVEIILGYEDAGRAREKEKGQIR